MSDEPEAAVSSDVIRHCLRKYMEGIATPYGKIIEKIQIPLAAGGHHDLPVANPFAAIWYYCSISPTFSVFLHRHMKDCINDIAVWGDDVTCGNQLRPDSVTKYVSLYYTFVSLPEWFRSSEHGWLPLTFLKCDAMQFMKAKYSGLLKAVLNFMFTRTCNFTDGIDLPNGPAG
eukprot:5455916-Pyramimonas_sp.AAC.1